ncbi:MAG TPA: hypothetical protein VMJ93_00045 [Verrucomicrobiae bacterium]|nr:hypothetical protein [Verrucomicrobiae bacterium]
MNRVTAAAAMLLLAMPAGAQSRKAAHRTEPDRLGMTCAQVLKFTSTEWVEKYVAAKSHGAAGAANGAAPSESPADVIRGVSAYAQCYDARTSRLASVLGRKGAGPLMGARGDFREFEDSLEKFEVIALANAQPPASDVKKAYAALYEKQFRYAFYQSYEPVPAKAAPSEPPSKKPAAHPKLEPGESSSLKPGEDSAGPAADEKSDDNSVAQFTKTKNRFGQLLEALPEDKSRQVHEAFGNILGAYELSQDTRRDVYLYAIFLLEPDSTKPFAPPPF